MKISKLDDAQAEIVRSNDGLANYLQNLEIGRKATPHSWLYENEDPAVTLKRWMRKLKKLENGSDAERIIYAFDCKQLEKYGWQGEVPPIKEAIKVESFQEQYELTHTDVPAVPPLTDVIRIPRKSVRLRSYNHVVDDMSTRDTLTTNSGWDKFTKRSTVVPESIEDAETGVAYTYPAIILFRNYHQKLRVVWMYPMSMNLLEYRITQPLQEAIQKVTQYVTPWKGFEDVKQRFTVLWNKHPYAFGGDTTAMDAHMQLPQLSAVADSCESVTKDARYLRDTLLHVAKIDIVIGLNSIIKDQEHGIASGSGWTQLSETIFQMLVYHSYLKEKRIDDTVESGMGIGDDYVWFFDRQPDSEDIVKFWEKFGLPGKPEKQSNDEHTCTFLQRLFIKGYYSYDDKAVLGGVYPTIRALSSLLMPEKFHNPKDWNSDMFCARTYMILENTVDHPLFEEFVKFVVAGQKDLLPFAKYSDSELDEVQRKARLLPGLNPSYNTEKRNKPLSSFSSIRYARTLR
jgi:hypothetical protein